MANRRYEGDPLDHRYQHITERPALEDDDRDDVDDQDDVVYVTDPEPQGEVSTENVPVPEDPEESGTERTDGSSQTTLSDYQ